MLQIKQFIFQNAASSAKVGEELENDQGGSLTVVVGGTFTGTLKVQGKLDGQWNDIAVINTANAEVQTSITAAGAYSVLCVDGFESVRVNLTAISAGSVRAVGRLCY